MREGKTPNRKKTIYLWIGSVAAAGAVMVMLLLCIRGLYIKRENLLSAYEKQVVSGIVCFGDSLTAGAGGAGTTYPLVLEERLRKRRIYIPVANMGVGGENTVTIAGRAGAVPFQTNAFTIPAEAVPTEISFQEEEGKEVRIADPKQGDAGLNPCVIQGVEGNISAERLESGELVRFFTRKEPGNPVEVSEGAKIETWAQTAFTDYIFVVFMGENGGFDSPEELVEQQKAILSLQGKEKEKYIIIGISSGSREERKELETVMEEAFGEHYINIREYLSTQGVYDAGIEPSKEDLKEMKEGIIPSCLLTDSVHFNEKGYRLIGNLLYERMEELGFFTQLEEIVEEYGSIF